MKANVDPELCVGCETCVEMCPDMFEMQGETAVAKSESVPDNLRESCLDAAGACPVEAIIIEE